jgi:ABC-type multidrug transport system ATPase subunit
MHEFVPQRTAAYISQQDLQLGELTVRETLDFSGRCQGVGTRSGERQSQFCCKLMINIST